MRYFLHTNNPGVALRRYALPTSPPNRAYAQAAVALLPKHNHGPLSLLVADGSFRRVHNGVMYRVAPFPLNGGSVYRLGNGLLGLSPEACFVQLAITLPFLKAVQAGVDLCGTYRIDEYDRSVPRSPITSTERIRSFVKRMPGAYGTKKALKVLNWVADGSASPAETFLYLMVRLPRRLGGAGFSPCVLNKEFRISGEYARVFGSSTIRPDVYLSRYGVALEYDSLLHHGTEPDIERDSLRRSIFAGLGVRAVSVTRAELYRPDGFAVFEKSLHTLTGKKWHALSDAHRQARTALRRELLRNDW